jgi:hypothetical protein
MRDWLMVTLANATLNVRMLLVATFGLLSAPAFAQASQSDGSSRPPTVDLGRVIAISRSAADWVQDSVGSLGHRKLMPRAGACENGLAPGCAFIDRQWFGDRPNEHYEGEFRNGGLNGHGIYTWSDGRRYEGEFRDSKLNGYGVLTWPDGSSYEGEWADSRASGVGKLTTANGTFNGIWTDGCFPRGRTWMVVGSDLDVCQVFKRHRVAAMAGGDEAQRQLAALIGCVLVQGKSDKTCAPK